MAESSTAPLRISVVERAIELVSPSWALRRERTRVELEQLQLLAPIARREMELSTRRYEASAQSRRTQNWYTSGNSAQGEIGPALERMRQRSRDLVRNNPWASKAIAVIEDDVVGTGIVPRPMHKDPKVVEEIKALWRDWAESTACDPAGNLNFYGLQSLAVRSMVEGGDSLARRRWRRKEDGLPVPLQIQLLEGDHVDPTKDGVQSNGIERIHGAEFDPVGRLRGYWVFKRHPGDHLRAGFESDLIDAEDVLLLYRLDRIGQVRGVPWGAPCLLRVRDLDEYEDAHLLHQKLANMLGLVVRRPVPNDSPLATVDPDGRAHEPIETFKPAMVQYLNAGEEISQIMPPPTEGYSDYTTVSLRAAAAGYGVMYEALSGDLTRTNYSSYRAGGLVYNRRVDSWRWNTVVPRFCDRSWRWFIEACAVARGTPLDVGVRWSPPRRALLDPQTETRATKEAIRAGQMSRQDACREQGLEPDEVLAEIEQDQKDAIARGVLLDCYPASDLGRKREASGTTQQ